MRDASDLPFTFLHDLIDDADPWVEPAERDTADERHLAARAAMLDATANVLAAMRELIQTAEDVVRLRRERLTEDDVEAPLSTPPSGATPNGHKRQRIDFTD